MFGLLPIQSPALPRYHLVWSDEFKIPGKPNERDWSYENGFVRNQELQWYQPENASVSRGNLVIEGRREAVQNSQFEEGSSDWRRARRTAEYTSACMTTLGKHSWLYGRFEVRARIHADKGLWPAIWMLGTGKPWPHCGEVDILEFYRNTILANTVYGDGVWKTVRTPYPSFLAKDPSWDSKFHFWRMDWTPEYIRIYLDNQLLNETDLSKTIDSEGSNPFHAPMYLLLNLAIGSTGGDPSTTKFPTVYQVDYVRVYQSDQK